MALEEKSMLDKIQALPAAYPGAVQKTNFHGYMPLQIALKEKAAHDVVQALLAAYPEAVQTTDGYGDLPLHSALRGKAALDVVQALLAAYPEAVQKTTCDGDLPLHSALEGKAALDVVQALLAEYPEAVQKTNGCGHLPMHIALELKMSPVVVGTLFHTLPKHVQGTDAVLCIAAFFAQRPDFKGLSSICSQGVCTLTSFRNAVEALVGKSQADPDGSQQGKLNEVLHVLRVWHHGSLLLSHFMDRSLMQTTLAGSARLVTAFLYGEPAREITPVRSDICVIERCRHSEPAVGPDEVTDEIIANLVWAQTVEQQILAGMHIPSLMCETVTSLGSDPCQLPCIEGLACTGFLDGTSSAEEPMHRPTEFGDKIYLVKVTRSVESLRNALHTGRDLEEVRAAASDRHQSCKLPSGASIFVYPDQYQIILSTISQSDLRSHHVIIAEAFLPFLSKAIASIPCRHKVKVSNSKLVAWVDDCGLEIAIVERTFLKVKSMCLENMDEFTQSTSQARNIPNQRMYALKQT